MAIDEGSGPTADINPAFDPREFEAKIRKFAGYVLVPGHESGKDRVFINRLGFRARNVDDARALVDLYLNQARSAVAGRDYELGATTEHGIRCTIIVRVRDVAIRSGWLLRPDGVLELITPFSGFARSPRKEAS